MRVDTPLSPFLGQANLTQSVAEFWNREELYEKVWKLPISQLTRELEVSRSVLVRVCQKLQIPRPEQGHWGRIRAGLRVSQVPLPPVRNLPFVPRVKKCVRSGPAGTWDDLLISRPDAAIEAIRRVESTARLSSEEARTHRLTSATEAVLRSAKRLEHGCILRRPYSSECLDLRVSRNALHPALRISNAILLLLEEEGFALKVERNNRRTIACIFEQEVPFYLREKLRLVWRRERKDPNFRTFQYRPTGNLEFRCGRNYLSAFSLCDSPQIHLDHAIHLCVAGLMREARTQHLFAKQNAQIELRRQRKLQKLAELSKRVAREQGKLDDLQDTVATWKQAQEIRHFVAAVENHSPQERARQFAGFSNRKSIKWMKQQADRLDPFTPNPPSILDHKRELRSDSHELLWPMLFEQAIFSQAPHIPTWWRRKGHHLRNRR